MTLQFIIRPLGIMVLGLIGAACNEPAQEVSDGVMPEFAILTHANAFDEERITSSDGDAKQLSYSLKISHPETAVDERMLRSLASLGWRKCEKPGGAKWSSTPQLVSDSRLRCSLSHIQYLARDNQLMSIIHTYLDQIVGGNRCPNVPDSDIQTVVVLVSAEPDLAANAARMRLSCNS